MKNLLIVTADTNDADYINSITEVSNETIEQITGIVKKIKDAGKKNCYGFPWDKGESRGMFTDSEYEDILTEDEIEFLDGYIPYGEYGVHTVSNIEVYKNIGDKEDLLK